MAAFFECSDFLAFSSPVFGGDRATTLVVSFAPLVQTVTEFGAFGFVLARGGLGACWSGAWSQGWSVVVGTGAIAATIVVAVAGLGWARRGCWRVVVVARTVVVAAAVVRIFAIVGIVVVCCWRPRGCSCGKTVAVAAITARIVVVAVVVAVVAAVAAIVAVIVVVYGLFVWKIGG